MINSSAVREELQNELSTFINNLTDHRQRDYMRFIFCGEDKLPNWGSLARGSLLLLLSGGRNGSLRLARAAEMIHHASLIVDDQIDKAHTRRGRPSFWIKYSPEECVLFSHMMVAMAINDLASFDLNFATTSHAHMSALKTIRMMVDAELEIRQTPFDSLETYMSHASRKTGALYRLVGQLAGLIPTTIILYQDQCLSGLEMVGVMHQMLDDFLDSDPTLRRNSLFVSADAERENRERSVYRLLKHGLTLGQLREFHSQYSRQAIQILEQSLRNGPEKEAIMSLCEEICLEYLVSI